MRFLSFNDAAYVLPLPLTNDLLARVVFFSVTPPPVGQQSIVMSVSVCLQAYLRYHNPFFMNFCASFLHDRGLVLSWRRCDTLCSLLPVL